MNNLATALSRLNMQELVELVERQNNSGDPNHTSIAATFLRVTVTS